MAIPIQHRYLLSLFYTSLAESAPLVARAKSLVQELTARKTDYNLLGSGEGTCSIGFVTDRPLEQISDHFKPLQGLRKRPV